MRARGVLFLFVVGALLLGACGSDDAGVSAQAGKRLDAQVNGIRASAARADRNTATQQLALLRASVDQLQSDGELSASAADRIRRSADEVQAQLVLLPAPSTTTTSTTTTTTSPRPTPPHGPKDDPGHREGKEKNTGNGKGH